MSIVGRSGITTQSTTLFANNRFRSFASLSRMTALRFVVILLSKAKDLYEMCTNNILNPSSYLHLRMKGFEL